MSFAIVIFGLIMIIMIHEGGHFLAARAVGIRATKFYLFFPPKLFAVKRGDVEYGVGMIPLGGFVKLPGMFEPLGTDIAYRFEHAVERVCDGLDSEPERETLRESWRMLGNAHTADMLDLRVRDLQRMIATTLASHPEPAGSRASEPATVWRRSIEGFVIRLDGVLDDLHPKAYWRAPVHKRMIVIAAGPGVNIVLGFLILWITAMLLVPSYRLQSWDIKAVSKGSAAEKSGIVTGSHVVSWNGVKPGTTNSEVDHFVNTMKESLGHTTTVVVDYHGVSSTHRLVPAPLTRNGKPRLGISSTAIQKFHGYERHGPVESLGAAWNQTGRTISAVVTGLQRTVQPQHFHELGTIVGIVKIAPKFEQARELLPYLGSISLVLAIFNLLPILPLDGGHLAFGFAEWLRRGRPVSRMVMEKASVLGLILMLGLFAIGLRNDLGFGG